jgi:hypothetical protein
MRRFVESVEVLFVVPFELVVGCRVREIHFDLGIAVLCARRTNYLAININSNRRWPIF